MIKIKIGPAEVGIAVVTLLVASVVGYQFADIKKNTQDGTLASADQAEEAKEESEIAANEQQSKEVDVPAQETPETELEDEKPPEVKEQAEAEEAAAEVVGVTASAGQRASLVYVTATLSRPLTGTCYIKFERSGYEEVTKLVTVTNSATCIATMSRTDFGATGAWDVHAKFKSLDKAQVGEATTKLIIN